MDPENCALSPQGNETLREVQSSGCYRVYNRHQRAEHNGGFVRHVHDTTTRVSKNGVISSSTYQQFHMEPLLDIPGITFEASEDAGSAVRASELIRTTIEHHYILGS